MDNLTWISTLSIYLHHCSIQLEDIVGEVAEPWNIISDGFFPRKNVRENLFLSTCISSQDSWDWCWRTQRSVEVPYQEEGPWVTLPSGSSHPCWGCTALSANIFSTSYREFASIQKDANSDCNCKFVESLKGWLGWEACLGWIRGSFKIRPRWDFWCVSFEEKSDCSFLLGFNSKMGF